MSPILDFLVSAGDLLRDIVLPIFALIFAGWLADRKFSLDLDTLVKLKKKQNHRASPVTWARPSRSAFSAAPPSRSD